MTAFERKEAGAEGTYDACLLFDASGAFCEVLVDSLFHSRVQLRVDQAIVGGVSPAETRHILWHTLRAYNDSSQSFCGLDAAANQKRELTSKITRPFH